MHLKSVVLYTKTMKFSTIQKILILLIAFVFTFIGFMIKLPSVFRSIDQELHALFYFLAAAFLNVLFGVKKLLPHALIFFLLHFFGIAIEYLQSYSNRFFKTRIHGRYDPLDVEYNLKGLILFSILWVVSMGVLTIYKKSFLKNQINKE
jgi:hypothetical protein